MFELHAKGWSYVSGLELVQADVEVRIGGAAILDEPVCVDAGLPALLLSATKNVRPDRFAEPDDWKRTPYFVCGCGDASCRAFVYETIHDGAEVEWVEWEQTEFGTERRIDAHRFALSEYQRQIFDYASRFLGYIRDHEYRPDVPGQLERIEELTAALGKRIGASSI